MVRRTDGTDVRLHPQQKKNSARRREAVPVFGKWKEWSRRQSNLAAHTSLPPSCAIVASSHLGGELAFEHVSQADIVANSQAAEFLDKCSD
eukprot:2201130-Alexandrium_andersonii.AAC.1